MKVGKVGKWERSRVSCIAVKAAAGIDRGQPGFCKKASFRIFFVFFLLFFFWTSYWLRITNQAQQLEIIGTCPKHLFSYQIFSQDIGNKMQF